MNEPSLPPRPAEPTPTAAVEVEYMEPNRRRFWANRRPKPKKGRVSP